MNFKEILSSQKVFFNTQETKKLSFRKTQLKKLKWVIQKNEDLLYDAIYKDFGKSKFDTFTTEISFLLKDIDFYLTHLNALAKPQRVSTNLANQIGRSTLITEPLGAVLVIGAWNYPYQLSFSPTIAALAAGNTVILKPSEIAENTLLAMEKIINENFDSRYFFVAKAGITETTEILKLRFDKIFFTGSTKVGKIVYEAAAKNLTPVVLELGGKSPVIVTENANLKVAAKRIIWGKFLNAGQTCIAPDYLYVHEKIKEKFLKLLIETLKKFSYQIESEHYTKIINSRNFDRLVSLIDPKKNIFGGQYNKENLFIEPTILDSIDWQDKVMQEEIFGPILPVLSYTNFNEVMEVIHQHEKPLSAYLFSNKNSEKKQFLQHISFGGGCINDVVMHISNDNLPFGGVGNSGIGNYHGSYGFHAFSHQKGILTRTNWGEPNLKYPPYSDQKLSIIKKLL